jgi:hypothetical protein
LSDEPMLPGLHAKHSGDRDFLYRNTMEFTTNLPDNWGILIGQKDPEAIQLLHQVYQALFNQTIQQGCGNCYQKAYFKIQKYWHLSRQNNPQQNTNMSILKRKYILKPGRSLQTSFGGDTLTNDNLTDEAAAKLLQKHPSLAKHFEQLPEVIETPGSPDVIKSPKETKTQAGNQGDKQSIE